MYELCIIETFVTITKTEYESLLALVEELRTEILLLKSGKNSKTSHTPPSQDIGRSNTKSLREQSGKKSGGQFGHKGTTLLMKSVADKVIDHFPIACNHCGYALESISTHIVEERQEVVLPLEVKAQYVAHQKHEATCPHCLQKNQGIFPNHITSSIQYGPSVESLVGYLNVYQYMPYQRISNYLRDMFELPISEGTIQKMLVRLAQKAQPQYEAIQAQIAQSEVVGGDETGTSIGGKKGWFHTWQNRSFTFIAATMNRGFATVANYFPNGFPESVYVSDCWAAQLKVTSKAKQICIAHLLRELKNFEESIGCGWSIALKDLLKKAIILKHELKAEDYQNNQKVAAIKIQLSAMLQIESNDKHKKVQTFIKRLQKNEAHLLTFLTNPEVPPDNNASERAIRNIKVKTKVSSHFRTLNGAEIFARIRSLVDTALKNNQNVFSTFQLIANLKAE